MKLTRKMRVIGVLSCAVTGVFIFMSAVLRTAFAHCDTMKGPVIMEARAALEKGDVTPVLKWVKKEHESEIRDAFAKAVTVRSKGLEAKELAERFFFETLVRVHRAGEGAPFTGIKDEPVEPVVAMADKALADGSAKEVIKKISEHMAKAIQEKFERTLEAAKMKDKSLEAGREFVEAYVTYTHYIEGIHTAILSGGAHAAESGQGHAEHKY